MMQNMGNRRYVQKCAQKAGSKVIKHLLPCSFAAAFTMQVSLYLSPCSLCCLICTTSSMTGAIDGHRRTSLLWRVSCYWRQLNPSVWTPPRQSCLWTTNCSTNRKCCVIPSSKGQDQICEKETTFIRSDDMCFFSLCNCRVLCPILNLPKHVSVLSS